MLSSLAVDERFKIWYYSCWWIRGSKLSLKGKRMKEKEKSYELQNYDCERVL